MKWLRKLFLIREIKNQKGELHFQRWRLLQTPWFAIYIHRIYRADKDKHCHDHPWSFVSVILSGGYSSRSAGPFQRPKQWRCRTIGSIKYNKSTSFHMIESLFKIPTTTLVFTGPRNREWGYNVDGEWVHNKEYRSRKRAGEWK